MKIEKLTEIVDERNLKRFLYYLPYPDTEKASQHRRDIVDWSCVEYFWGLNAHTDNFYKPLDTTALTFTALQFLDLRPSNKDNYSSNRNILTYTDQQEIFEFKIDRIAGALILTPTSQCQCEDQKLIYGLAE